MKNKLKYGMVFLLVFVVSCKTGKETASIALPVLPAEERINSVIQSGIRYNNWSAGMKLTVRRGKTTKETSVDAQLRIVRNEAIQISLRIPLLGSEAFRILLTPDKLLIIDRLNKQYLWEDLQELKTRMTFDYYSLEALLTNQLFIAGQKQISPEDYGVLQVRDEKYCAHITYSDQQKIRYDFESDYTHRIQSARMEQSTGAFYLQCDYTDWGLTSNRRTFPMLLNFRLQTPEETYELNCAYKSVSIDTTFAIDYTIPGKYRRVTLEQVIPFIKSLL